MGWEDNQLNNHLQSIDDTDAREQSVETLAEALILAATHSAHGVVMASAYDASMADIVTKTNHDDAFNDLYYAIAERIIKQNERG